MALTISFVGCIVSLFINYMPQILNARVKKKALLLVELHPRILQAL